MVKKERVSPYKIKNKEVHLITIALVVGALLGILGNLFVNSLFAFFQFEQSSFWIRLMVLIITTIGFVWAIQFLIRKLLKVQI